MGALLYRPEEFVGRIVVVSTNLEPKKIGNIISRGMLLATDGPEDELVFLTMTGHAPVGATIH